MLRRNFPVPFAKYEISCALLNRVQKTLVFLTKIRNVALRKNRTKWKNTDTQLPPNEFLKNDIIRQIAIHELVVVDGGGVALKDFLEYLEMVSEGAMAKIFKNYGI